MDDEIVAAHIEKKMLGDRLILLCGCVVQCEDFRVARLRKDVPPSLKPWLPASKSGKEWFAFQGYYSTCADHDYECIGFDEQTAMPYIPTYVTGWRTIWGKRITHEEWDQERGR